jgi:5-formyltetrahydrofolate cyclo-ligase
VDKAALRQILIRQRGLAFAAGPDAGEALAANFPFELPQGACLAGYYPFRTEIDPRPLMQWASGTTRLCLPRTPPKGVDAALNFHSCDPSNPDALERSAWGVIQPIAACPQVRPDIVLVPLLGFDAACNRIGQGQGHYDRTLAHLRTQAPVIAIGLAFEAQRLDCIPIEPHDQPLDWILTEKQAYRRA